MDQNQPTQTLTAAPRKAPHPMYLIAAASVAAVAVIAGAQMLRPTDAASSQRPAAPAASAAAASTGSPAATRSAAPASSSTGSASTPPASTACATCGVIVGVREVRQAGEGTGVGAVAGGVVGGVVGHQFGAGHGKDALTIAGAVGGAMAGHQIEKQARATTSWRVDVKMTDGTTRTFHYGTQPAFAAGERVEVKGTQLVARS
jgi:outer membrane lipoprotein SlyB